MDVSSLSFAELLEQQRRLENEVAARRKQAMKETADQVQHLIAESGFSVQDVVAILTSSHKKTRAQAQIKYRHPDTEGLTWVGRGKKPRWIVEWEASGKSLDALKVSGQK